MIRHWIADRDRSIFGFKITPVLEREIIEAVEVAQSSSEQLVIASMNLHGLYVAVTDPQFEELHSLPQSLVHTDGIAIVWSAWLHRIPLRVKHRTGVHDWLPVLAEQAERKGWSMYCLGSDLEVNTKAIGRLRADFPDLVISGQHGFFDSDAASPGSELIIQAVTDFDPDILVVGMGMGRQERWIVENLDRLGARTIITCGACLEYVSGIMPMSPRWFGPVGLEMVFRVVTRPRRYAYRYLIEPWDLAWKLLRRGQLLRPLVQAWMPNVGLSRR